MKLNIALLFMMLFTPVIAGAQTITFKGKELITAAPKGYCEVGGNDQQEALLEQFRNETGENLKVIAMWVPCDTIPAISKGEEVVIPRWLLAYITTPKGNEILLPYERAEYIRRMSEHVPQMRLNEAEVKARFSVPPKEADRVGKSLLGPGPDAFFFEAHKQAALVDGSVWLRLAFAQTVINSIPLTLMAYERTDLAGDNGWDLLNELLRAMLAKNPGK